MKKLKMFWVIMILMISVMPSELQAKKAAQTNSFESPDFAFPQTVINNAEPVFRQALASGSEADLIKAAIQLAVAEDDISTERMPAMAAMLDSAANSSHGAARSLLLMLQAKLYSEVYQANSYTFRGRNLPLDSFPADPQLWSEDLFALKVTDLVRRSLESIPDRQVSPLAPWHEFFTGIDSVSAPFYPTLYSVMAPIGMRFLQTFTSGSRPIPFAGAGEYLSPAQKAASLMTDIAKENARLAESSADPAWIAIALPASLQGLDAGEAFSILTKAYRNNSNSPYSVEILRACSSLSALSDADKMDLKVMIKEAIDRYPDYQRINALKNYLADSAPDVDVKIPAQVIPGKEFMLAVKKAHDATDLYLQIYKLDKREDPTSAQVMAGAGKLVASYPLTADTLDLKCAPLASGFYAVAISRAEKTLSETAYPKRLLPTFTVSGMQALYSSSRDGSDRKLYIVSAIDGAPIQGVQVAFMSRAYGKKTLHSRAVTGKDGSVVPPDRRGADRNLTFEATLGSDMLTGSTYQYASPAPQESLKAQIFTSLALYKPGQKCEFALVCYSQKDAESKLLAELPVRVRLFNASGEQVDSLQLTTDANARAHGEFTLPESGMLGSFSMVAEHDGRRIGYASLHVEQYRQPGFYVEISSERLYYSLGETFELTGVVKSYSGMPMAGAEVNVAVDYRQPWWRAYYGVAGSYAARVKTDTEGRFSLSLPTYTLAGTPFAQGDFAITATSTSAAGETQSSQPIVLSLGAKLHVSVLAPDLVDAEATDKFDIIAKVEGVAATPQLSYALVRDGRTVLSGALPEKGVSLDSSSLQSGEYTAKVFVAESPELGDEQRIIIYRPSEKLPPVDTALWVPQASIHAKDGKSVKVPVRSSFENQHMIALISDSRKIISRNQFVINAGCREIDIPAPEAGEQMSLYLFTVRDAKLLSSTVTVLPPERSVKMQVISFRDKVNAGGKERWSFKYSGLNTSVADMPVIATLSDKSLNAIVPFNWSWPSYSYPSYGFHADTFLRDPGSYMFFVSSGENRTYPDLTEPWLFTYSRPLYPAAIRIRGTMYANAAAPRAMMAKSAVTADGAVIEEVSLEEPEVAAGAADEAEREQIQNEQLRPSEMPLAWFKPSLCCDAEGNLEIAFDMPDFNTTWQLQLMAYNDDMLTDKTMLTAVASKPVMIKPVAPRFLRTSDRASLAATVFNNTGGESLVAAELEIFNPLTGEVIESRNFDKQLIPAQGSCVVAIEFSVPADMQFIAYRAIARAGEYTDGEQSLISILPSSSPVTETYPFYMEPGDQYYTAPLPELPEGSMVELQYCDNPVWYCVTALPSLALHSDAGILSLVNSIYGSSIAQGLLKTNPRLGEAVRLWKATGDSALVSPLEKNPELKIAALDCTPWVLNASAETLRMQQLSEVLDASKAKIHLDKTLSELLRRQTPGGGWSWCEGMQPSVFISANVLERLGMLRFMGYSPEDSRLDEAETRAIEYVDAELVKDWKKYKQYSLSSMLSWFYIRSFFKSAQTDPATAALKNNLLKRLKNEWKELDIYNAASAAILLNREGYPMLAREILVSLSQRATRSEQKGMWYDNLSSGFSGANDLMTTARVLEAFAAVNPSSEDIDKLRQWLVIEKQARDWGSDSQLAEVVWSILSTGTSWTETVASPAISVAGKRYVPSAIEQLTGSFTIPLGAADASGAQLQVTRSGYGPAWGGLALRYIAPIADVKGFSQGEVSVEKNLLLVREDSTGVHLSPLDISCIEAGSKVRVQLIVTTGRDMDYVTITDEQAGSLLPADQVSGYKFGSSLSYYREVREGVTNLFISRLPKGRYIIEYDCFAEGAGTYALGIATLQSLYAPMLSAHSAGKELKVVKALQK